MAATGIGKTYLAAFDHIKAERVLFVAHREEIIKQAARSFKNVRKSENIGFFYNSTKDTDKAMIFVKMIINYRSHKKWKTNSYCDKL